MNTSNQLGAALAANSEKLLTCVHCGLCLPACPTYRVLGNENDSPRGRIYLMRGVVEGKLAIAKTFSKHIDLCLGCRACETACPSGVPYGHLLETARAEIVAAQKEHSPAIGRVVSFVLNQVFTRPALLGAAMRFSKLFRDSGAARFLFNRGFIKGRLKFALAVLLSSRSPFAGKAKNKALPAQLPSTNPPAKMRVAVLRGCVMEGLFTEANRATERVLAHNHCEVIEAKGQQCCGALHAHAGHLEGAKQLARHNIEAFLESGCEAIIINSAGCGAAMKEYQEWFADDPEVVAKAQQFSAKVKDISEFLVERGITPPAGSVNRRVTYDAPCHLLHAQKIANPPLDLLKSIPGLTFTPLQGSEHCCGGAGIYNLQHPELSAEILATKLDNIKATGADTLATANPGCIMQLGAGALLNGIKTDVIHPVELLDAAYQKSDD